MKRIYKYSLETDIQENGYIDLPVGSKVLTCGLDGKGDLCFWARVEVNPDEPEKVEKVPVKFLIFYTGTNLPEDLEDNFRYVGTIIDKIGYVYHVYAENMV